MSFSKSKRFPYSSTLDSRVDIPKKVISVISDDEKWKYATYRRHSIVPQETKEADKYSRRSSMNNNNNRKITHMSKGVKTLKKIANTFSKTFSKNVLSKGEYNVRKEQKRLSREFNNISLDTSFTWEGFKKEVRDIKQSSEELENVLVGTSFDSTFIKDDSVDIDGDEVVTNFEEAIRCTNTNIKYLMEETIGRMKDESERKVAVFLRDLLSQNTTILEDMRNQCQYSMENLNEKMKGMIARTAQLDVKRDQDLRSVIQVLNEQLNESKCFAKYLDDNYSSLVESAEKKILQQTKLIESLKAEIDAMELTSSMERVLNTQKTRKSLK